MTARDICRLLAARHDKDVFIHECKDGPTHSVSSHAKIDAWVMKSSWTNPAFIGYEIKVSRNDFMRDTKWPRYLPMCNELYFVTPWSLVGPSEVPEGVGLIWVTKTGTRLHTKVRAQHREIAPPIEVLMYALMCRARISNDRSEPKAEFWRRWLAERETKKGLGNDVRTMITKRYRDELRAANDRARDAEHRALKLEQLADQCKFLGVDPEQWGAAQQLAERVSGQIPADIRQQAKWLSKSAADLLASVEKHNGEAMR